VIAIRTFRCALAAAAGALATTLAAAVVPDPIFSDHMVVQHGVPVPFHGKAGPGEEVVIEAGGKEWGRARADDTGAWRITAPPAPVGPLPEINIRGPGNSVTIRDALAGDVWLCAGQSNMRMTVSPSELTPFGGVVDEKKEVAAADYPGIRFFTDRWIVCSPETVGGMSGTAYFFGRELHRELGRPVGLLTRAVGGTAIEVWVPPAAFAPDLERRAVEAYRPFYDYRRELHREQTERMVKRREQGAPTARAPAPPVEPENYPRGFSRLYEREVAPLAGYPLAGVLWYQGESNTRRGGAYEELLTALIGGWRAAWGDPDLPFVIVQLADYEPPDRKAGEAGDWAELRAAQARAADKVPRTALAVALGAGEADNLHPRNKQEVGRRSALRALEAFYGKETASLGPAPERTEWRADSVAVTFRHAAGLSWQGRGDAAFELAGVDGVFHPAKAVVDGTRVTVSSPAVAEPAQLRYAWANCPGGLLVNDRGLVAAPFRDVKP
jgi:sialate O-acetylesterase